VFDMYDVDFDRMVKEPKDVQERVAVCFFLIMTCPDTKKNEAKLQNILNHMCKDLEMLDQSLWTETQDIARALSVKENIPFYQENMDWMESKLAEVTGSVQRIDGVH
tara:strand:- start:66 stop:386 length:321 start_codon:yes stop_codon:yes gene_type:complete